MNGPLPRMGEYGCTLLFNIASLAVLPASRDLGLWMLFIEADGCVRFTRTIGHTGYPHRYTNPFGSNEPAYKHDIEQKLYQVSYKHRAAMDPRTPLLVTFSCQTRHWC